MFLEIKRLNGEANKWNKIFEIASNYGFTGIQLNQKVYNEQLGLSLRKIPGFMNKFRLTYHIGGVSPLATDEDYSDLSNRISESLEISDAFGIEDVSFHPPLINEENEIIRDISKRYLTRLIEHWLPKFQDKKVTLSLETHVTSKYFVFKGLRDYHDHVSKFRDLGVLIEISHNCYDKYSVDDIIETLSDLKITGLHLSDANANADFREGTHLPIGKGNVDFKKIIESFKDKPDIYGALEIKGSSADIINSIRVLSNYLEI